MTIRTATGLTLALSLLTYPLPAQEVQWRASAPPTVPMTPTAEATKPATTSPAWHAAPAATPAGTPARRSVTLARPVAIDRSIHDSALMPVSFRPVGIVRAPMDGERMPAPLPSGPTLPTATEIADPKGSEVRSEVITVRPRPVDDTDAKKSGDSGPVRATADCTSCGLDGGSDCCASCGSGCASSGGCECSCLCDMCCSGRGFGRRRRRSSCGSCCCAPVCCDCCSTECCDCGAADCCIVDSCCTDACCCDVGCCDTCCSACGCFVNGCTSRQIFWGSVEYLLWTITPDNVSPLLTTGPITDGLQVGNPGGLNTSVLYGKNQLADPLRNGARFTFGAWLPGAERLGLEASYFFLGRQDSNFFVASNGNPILIRPTINAGTGDYRAVPTAYPAGGVLAPTVGDFRVRNTSELWGLEANLRGKLWCGPCWWIDGLIGYRHLDLQESLTVLDSEGDPGGVPDRFLDQFATRNNFNGGQLGIEGQWNFFRRWTVGGFAKVALGNVNQILGINGRSTVPATPGTNEVSRGGFLALESNIGSFQANRFAVMPNAGVRLGWNATEHLRFFVGYEFLYLSNVIRVGEQVDVRINPNLIPGPGSSSGSQPRQPAVLFRTNDFWAYGVNFGVLYYW